MKTVRIHELTHAKIEKLRKKIAKTQLPVTQGEAIDLAVTEKLEKGK